MNTLDTNIWENWAQAALFVFVAIWALLSACLPWEERGMKSQRNDHSALLDKEDTSGPSEGTEVALFALG